MAIYLGTIIFLSFLSIIELRLDKKEKKEKKIIEIIAFAVVLLLAILRNKTVGGDLINYERSFLEWRSIPFSDIWGIKNSDVGFVLINWLVGKFTDNVYGLMIVMATLTYTFIFMSLRECSANISMSFVIFMAMGGFADVFSGLRQTLAVGIVFWSVVCLIKKKYVKYVIWLLVAASIHTTAIIGILYGIIVFTKHKNIFCLKIVLMMMLTTVIATIGIPFMVSLYGINDYSGLIVRGEGGKLLVFASGLLFLCYLKIKHSNYELNNIEIVAYNSCMVGITIQILAMGFSLLTKLTSFYWIFFIVLIPNLLMRCRIDKSKKAIIAIAIAFMYWLYITVLDLSGIVPYKFLWQ